MVLVDTSVWISHFRSGLPDLEVLLEEGSVACHPFIMGELACGHLQNRLEILSLLKALPEVQVAYQEDVLRFIHDRHLSGKGLGWVDMHLLASSMLTKITVWTLDKALMRSARALHVLHVPH